MTQTRFHNNTIISKDQFSKIQSQTVIQNINLVNTKKNADSVKKFNLNVKLIDQKLNINKKDFLKKTGQIIKQITKPKSRNKDQ